MTRAPELARALALARQALREDRNMIAALGEATDLDALTRIEIAYALQSGRYTADRDRPAATAYRAEVQGRLSTWLKRLDCRSVLDLGAGEGTTWHGWNQALDHLALLDLSLNRLSWAPRNTAAAPIREITCVKGEMGAPPVLERGFDAVVTMHALEPNGPSANGLVEIAASCAARLLVFFEPDYADAHDAMRRRMERHGYARDIFTAARALKDFSLIEAGRLDHPVNPDNATSFIALERTNAQADAAPGALADPLSRQGLTPVDGGFRDAAGDFVYPRLNGAACLAPGDGVLLGER